MRQGNEERLGLRKEQSTQDYDSNGEDRPRFLLRSYLAFS